VPRFMVERTFEGGLHIPSNDSGATACLNVVGKNANNGVTWVHSYVSADKTKTFCVYDGPDEAAIRASAEQTGLPVDAVTPVSVLDPYFYHD
jgi:8-oxo-dGTP pyrophosphatase MutT (NUDIX family)